MRAYVLELERASPPSPGVSRTDVEALPRLTYTIHENITTPRTYDRHYVALDAVLALFPPPPQTPEKK